MTSTLPRLALAAAAVAALLSACAAPSAPGTGAAPTAAGPLAVAPPGAAPTPAPAASGAGTVAQAASAPRPAASGPAATPPRPPGSPTPFAEVIKDAKSAQGLFTVWTKDEKTWLEIPAEWLDKPFFFGNSQASGLGQGFVLPGLMGQAQIVVLHRAGNTLQLIAKSKHAQAPDGTPLARAVAESYSDSLLASAPLAGAAHPERKSLLVDALALLGGDLMGMQTQLEAAFRMPYSLDRGNSGIERIRTSTEATTLTMRAHFAVPRIPAPPAFGPGAPPPNPAMLPNPPSSLPDARSLFLDLAYSFTPLPAAPMRARRADQRVGYFTSGHLDFGDDTSEGRRVHFINRWRLEKKDPAAAVSEPKEPIRVVMDRNIPEKWRDAVRSGILEWNVAFERAGFRNAIALEQQAPDADWTLTEASRLLAVRWFAMEGPGGVAVGPSQADPRTGEILRGAAIIPENFVRVERAFARDFEPRLASGAALQAAMAPALGIVAGQGIEFAQRFAQCDFAFEAIEQTAFGIELLAARNGFDLTGPEVEKLIKDSLKDVVMHEVGHALGLRHNFRGSMGKTQAQLRDPAHTRTFGVSNSVMDYHSLNMPLQGETVADYHNVALGAYDHWAIEYGYSEVPADAEKQALAAIAGRAEREPALAYGTDEDAYGNDPESNHWDLGDDPIAHARRQFKLARELWTLTQSRELKADDDLTIYRRNLQRGLSRIAQALPLVAKHVGGATTSRQLAGSGQALATPVPVARQREALDILVGEVFDSASFRFDPKFMSRLGIDQFERIGPNRFVTNIDYSLPSAVLGLQRGTLDFLMSETLASRLSDAESKVADPLKLLSYAEVQARLQDAVWSELKAAREVDSLRRNLQREHLRRTAGALIRPSSAAAADVRGVHRLMASRLEADLKRALASKTLTDTTRAHLAEAAQTLGEALRAPLMKQGV